jgi:hypothetical protein
MNRRADGDARKVQRRLIRYAVVVPAMKEIALAGVCPSPRAIKITSSPKSTIAEKPPVMMNRVSCAGSGRALSRSSTGSSTGCGNW